MASYAALPFVGAAIGVVLILLPPYARKRGWVMTRAEYDRGRRGAGERR